jgi:dihydrofolate reductase
MKLSLIVAMAMNRTIGVDKQMPWHLSADLKKFKKITMGHPIIMGRKTFESIGRPLSGRKNIIISRNSNYQQEGCVVFNSLEQAIEHCNHEKEVFVIGGATLYESILDKSDRLYVTEIKKTFKGDTWFPAIDKNQWIEYQREDIDHDASVDFSYSFVIYDRN